VDTENRTFGHARKHQAAAAPSRVLGLKELPSKGICFHPNHLRRLWERGDFPRPIKLSPRKLAWPEEVLDAWLASKKEAA